MRVTIKGGVWRNAEDEILKAAVMKYGLNQWARISSLLTRKSAKQCKARWYEWLDPSIKKTEWTREEDEKLLHLAKVMPTQWRTIAPLVGRTAQQCLERYDRLLDQVMHKEGDGDGGDDPRRLRAGDIDANPEGRPARPDPVDMDEDEKEMLAEARARLANTRGKKAKRKAREAQLEEARRLATLQKKRELKAAGIELRGRGRRERGINYNREVAFDLGLPEGTYNTVAEAQASAAAASEFRPMTIQQLEGPKRRDLEAQLIKEDIKKHNERKAADLPAVLGAGGPEEPKHRRFKMMLPQPQLSEAEYAQVMDGLKRGHALESELATPGASTQLLASDAGLAATAQRVARTPVRTPAAAQDRVRAEAQAQAHATRLQTPLLGQQSDVSLAASDFGAAAGPALSAQRTPNPLAAVATPVRTGLAGATPVRDDLGINTPSVLADTPSMGKRAERRRLQEQRATVRSDLKELPQPHNEYLLAGGAAGSRDAGADDGGPEDAADADARRERQAAAARADAFARRSTVMRRELPRPVAPPPAPGADGAAAPGSGADEQVIARADALVAAELRAVLLHDAGRYPGGGKSSKKRKRKLEALLDAGPSGEEAQFDQMELAEAAGLVAAEAAVLKDKYGHRGVSELECMGLMETAHQDHTQHPASGELVAMASLTPAERLVIEKGKHTRLFETMKREFEGSKSVEERFMAVVKGLVARDVKLGQQLRRRAAELVDKQAELICLQELERQEDLAIPRRKAELADALRSEQLVGEALQERYKELLQQLDGYQMQAPVQKV